jgi:quercetin dioxygenase-like cupin family protein
MKIIHFTDAKPLTISEDTAKSITGRMVIGKADGANNISMRVYELAKGGYTPWYFLDWEHEIFIFSGKGEILHNDKWTPLTEGYVVFIPAMEDHQIRNAGDRRLLS